MKIRQRKQRGVVTWVALLVLVVAVIGAWQFSQYKAKRKLQEQQQATAEAERKAVEERQAKEREQRDALTTSLKAVDGVVSRWTDAARLADNTGRGALSGPVTTLQAIKRDADQLTVPPCLDQGKRLLVSSMHHTIEGFLTFMRNTANAGSELARDDFEKAVTEMANYKKERANCPT